MTLRLSSACDVGLLEIFLHAEPPALRLEMLAVDGAEEERGHPALAQVLEKIERVGQRRDAGLQELERGVVMVIEFRQGRFGQVLLVELGEGEIELFAELLRGEGGLAVMLEDLVGRLEDRAEIVDQRAGPIENDVADFGHDCKCSGGSSDCPHFNFAGACKSACFTAAICACDALLQRKGLGRFGGVADPGVMDAEVNRLGPFGAVLDGAVLAR